MSTPEKRILSADIIAAELAHAYSRACGQGAPPRWIQQIREWPTRVIPSTTPQMRCATLTMLSITHWHHDHLRELTMFATPLYEARWCNATLIHILDYDPDGTRAKPWLGQPGSSPSGSLMTYLQRRLRTWRETNPEADGGRDLPAPPVAGVDFQSWLRRMIDHYGDGHAEPRQRQDLASAAATYWRNHSRATPLERLQTRIDRRRAVDEGLAELGAVPPSPPVDTRDDLALLAVPEVAAAVRELLQHQQPGRHRIEHLRECMRRARIANRAGTEQLLATVTMADVAQLAAQLIGPDGKLVHPEKVRRLLAKVW